MVCLRCNYNNDDSSIVCQKCGTDIYLNEKAKCIAIKLYNKGLSLARERKLTCAVRELKKSIYFDRFNIEARNVLGLVYFELGMIADALKQWAISASYYSEKNLATVYLARIKENVREMEKMDNAVKMYNQGLVNLKNKNDDMAVIQLKKAIELNPKLIEAKNLLAFIQLAANNSQQASALLDAVCAHDLANEKAQDYKDAIGRGSINAQRYRQLQHVSRNEPQKQYDPYIQKKANRFGRFPLSEVLCVLIGAACAAAAIYILVIPSIEASAKDEQEKLQGTITSIRQSNERALAEKDVQIEEITAKYEEALQENSENAAKMELLDKQQRIITALSFSGTGNIKGAADIIMSIDTTGLSDADLSQYNSIKETVFPQMAKSLFDEGRAAFNAGTFDEAKAAFIAGMEYGMTESNAGDAYYYLGRIAEDDEDLLSARQNYEMTINNYPGCTQYNNAARRLNALG